MNKGKITKYGKNSLALIGKKRIETKNPHLERKGFDVNPIGFEPMTASLEGVKMTLVMCQVY